MNATQKNTQLIVQTLKKLLKDKEMTYKDLGKKMGLTEASIKRLFSKNSCSINKVMEICDTLEVEFYDLVKESLDGKKLKNHLSEKQEMAFYNNIQLCHIFFDLLTRKLSIQEIGQRHQIPEAKVRMHLRELEDLMLIELHPQDRIKFLKEEPLTFSQGPFREKLFQQFLQDISTYLFDKNHAQKFKISQGREWLLSSETANKLQTQLQALFENMDQAAERDRRVYPKDQLQEVSFLIAGVQGDVLKRSSVSPQPRNLNSSN